jgi:crotonobetainyl-CoA:carnitine CoA-transferase CaiB-like acyl-CoA transferase
VRVLEVSPGDEAAAFCAKLFRRWGAAVTKVVPPHRAPAPRSLDIYLNSGKRRLFLDLRADRGEVEALAAEADVVVTDYAPSVVEELGLLDLGGPRTVSVSITPFGLSGPYRDYAATPATLLALGGYTFLMGDPGRAPLTMPGNYVHYQAGTYAYTAALAAHLGGAAPRIEVSMLECLASLHQFTDTMWLFGGQVRSRHGNRWENLCPTTLLQCHDGWYGVNILQNFWFPFAHMIGRPDIASEGELSTNLGRMERQDEVEEMITRALWDMPRKTIFKEGQETWRVPVGYAASLHDLLEDPHLNARGFWRPIAVEEGGKRRTVLTPGSPFRLVDEGLPHEPGPLEEPAAEAPAQPPAPAGAAATARPLAGVRILDLTRIWSGPLATRILGDLGAEVIKVESRDGRGGGGGPAGVPTRAAGGAAPTAPDAVAAKPWNSQPLFNKLNRNKKSIAIDLKAPRGREIFLDLVKVSDVVIENFSARAMRGLGLSYEEMRAVNPQVIYVAMQAFGQFGPYRDYVGLGPSIEPITGMTALMGYSDEEPRVTSKALTDAIAGTAGAAAVVTALRRRQERGIGCLVDLSQHETGIAYLGEHFLEAQLSGEEPHRLGNAHPAFAPHGVYRCRGDDQWIAIAVQSDADWQALCAELALGLAADHALRDVAARRARCGEIDAAIERATRGRDKRELERALQERGVAAGAVLSAPEYLTDPHLEARGYFVDLVHKETGAARWDGSPLLFDGARGYEDWSAAPCLGEDNRALLRALIGLSEAELDALYVAGVLAEEPASARSAAV